MERVRRAVAVEIENSPHEFYAMEEQYRRIVEEVAALARAAPVTPARGDGARAPVNRPEGRGGGQTRSSTTAAPCPPPTHRVAAP
jgi:hypothetical protein